MIPCQSTIFLKYFFTPILSPQGLLNVASSLVSFLDFHFYPRVARILEWRCRPNWEKSLAGFFLSKKKYSEEKKYSLRNERIGRKNILMNKKYSLWNETIERKISTKLEYSLQNETIARKRLDCYYKEFKVYKIAKNGNISKQVYFKWH